MQLRYYTNINLKIFRALVFAEKNYNSIVPDINLIDEDYLLLARVNKEIADYISVIENGKFREGIRHILSISRLGNQLMQASQPWVLCKGNEEEQNRGKTVIGLSVNLTCLLSILLQPYMPQTSEVIKTQLNAPSEVYILRDKFTLLLKPGHQLGKVKLFLLRVKGKFELFFNVCVF